MSHTPLRALVGRELMPNKLASAEVAEVLLIRVQKGAKCKDFEILRLGINTQVRAECHVGGKQALAFA